MDLRIRTRREDPWMVVEVGGELDLHTSTELRDQLASLTDAGDTRIAVDLADVSFMDSSSLGVLVACLKRVREKGGDVAVTGAAGSPLKVLSLTGMDKVFTMAATPAALGDASE
ncbi:MAG: STAS domain-containing protein [Actinomycetota bacterium]